MHENMKTRARNANIFLIVFDRTMGFRQTVTYRRVGSSLNVLVGLGSGWGGVGVNLKGVDVFH